MVRVSDKEKEARVSKVQQFPFRNQNLKEHEPCVVVSNSHIEFSAYSQRSKLPRALQNKFLLWFLQSWSKFRTRICDKNQIVIYEECRMDPIKYQNQFELTKGKQTRANQTRTGISELLKRRGQEYFTLVLTKND